MNTTDIMLGQMTAFLMGKYSSYTIGGVYAINQKQEDSWAGLVLVGN